MKQIDNASASQETGAARSDWAGLHGTSGFRRKTQTVHQRCWRSCRSSLEQWQEQIPDGIIIGADTVVCRTVRLWENQRMKQMRCGCLRQLKEIILYLPGDADREGKWLCDFETDLFTGDRVYLYAMTDEEIQDYIATGEPMDKREHMETQGRFAAYVEVRAITITWSDFRCLRYGGRSGVLRMRQDGGRL